ncbi:hypothetical protein KFK09_004136 [Dendrobium nobile]|uniref:Uncharacterized protein n=1 Tax=Dendrobium nobile TaxID=94219 RepID=A0A8T3C543_DENNO|nr:hypothetical protein KFK09_004136 [Dendrobium nobile]
MNFEEVTRKSRQKSLFQFLLFNNNNNNNLIVIIITIITNIKKIIIKSKIKI